VKSIILLMIILKYTYYAVYDAVGDILYFLLPPYYPLSFDKKGLFWILVNICDHIRYRVDSTIGFVYTMCHPHKGKLYRYGRTKI
jgi:hypothetical protein